MQPAELAPHPRLYISRAAILRLASAPRAAVLRHAAGRVAEEAEAYVSSPHFPWRRNTHNAHLLRARAMQRRIVTLWTRYAQTGARRYRAAVVTHVEALGNWTPWSWIAWRKNDLRPEAVFDLSYGENSATLAIAYDLLHAELTAAEKDLFLRIAERRALAPCEYHVAGQGGKRAHWFMRANSNWNAVCAGGAGLLCLAMHEDLASARRLLPALDASVSVFMARLSETGGGWEEGVGYWNYGMRYAFMYLLSHERACRHAHPMLTRAATRRTLSFPLDFTPRGVAAGFNDVNRWTPLPIHLAAALRLHEDAVARALDLEFARGPQSSTWPDAAELLLLHPRNMPRARRRAQRSVSKLYRGMGWGFLADRWPQPDLYCSVRGGSAAIPHGQRDLMSVNVVAGGEALIVNPQSGEYLDTTFSPRRDELHDLGPAAKNVILINGVGVVSKSSVDARRLTFGSLPALRIDATEAMGVMRDGPAARFCGRLVLLLAGPCLLLIDRVDAPQPALLETRLHSWASANVQQAAAVLQGQQRRLHVAYAATVPAKLTVCRPALTWPIEPPTLLRWAAADLVSAAVFATLIHSDNRPRKVTLLERPGRLEIRVSSPKATQRVLVSTRLLPVRAAT